MYNLIFYKIKAVNLITGKNIYKFRISIEKDSVLSTNSSILTMANSKPHIVQIQEIPIQSLGDYIRAKTLREAQELCQFYGYELLTYPGSDLERVMGAEFKGLKEVPRPPEEDEQCA